MSTDLDDFADLDFDDDVDPLDEFADLDDLGDDVNPNAVDLDKPLCATCGFGECIPGKTKRSKCQKCERPWGWDQVEEVAPKPKAGSKVPRPIMSGHCGYPQTVNPTASHERCAAYGAGSSANPEKRFHPCPCACHFPGEIYECAGEGCGGRIKEAPYLGLDEDGDAQYVHVNNDGRMLYVSCGGD